MFKRKKHLEGNFTKDFKLRDKLYKETKMTDNQKKIIKEWFTNPKSLVLFVYTRCVSHFIKDNERYLKILWRLKYGEKINLDNPQTLNEKLNWLKLNEFRPEFVKMVDKYEAKEYVASIIGREYIIPTFGVWDNFDDIDFSQLPDQFVMKCTHESGRVIICKEKSKLNLSKTRERINKSLSTNFYLYGRELPYKYVKPRIIAEKYLTDESGWQLKDYKIFCFNGEPKFIEVDYDRYVKHKLNVYDLDWNFVDFYMTSPNDKNVQIPRPEKLDEMLNLARKLAKDLTFVRVDFYSIYDKIYFGELTHYPGSGFIDFHPAEYDLKLGEMLNINK